MKTKYKYIEFKIKDDAFSGEEVWECRNRKKTVLGYVGYVGRWHEWEFQPEPMMGFTIECINDIADFLRQLNENKA